MSNQQFDREEYAKLKHRTEALKSRIELDTGAEQEEAKRLLAKFLKKIEKYENDHNIPKSAPKGSDSSVHFSSWSFSHNGVSYGFKTYIYSDYRKEFQEEARSEAEMLRDLGVLYAIFGSLYQTVLNYHVYKIHFKKQAPKNEAFYRVYSDIYEDDIRICRNLIIGFWPAKFGDDKCGDMEFAGDTFSTIQKYGNGSLFLYKSLLDGLKDIWNLYFDDQDSFPLLPAPQVGLFESKNERDAASVPNIQLSYDKRQEIIRKVESEINEGKMRPLLGIASKVFVMAYKPFASLSEFLENAGIVYKVEESSVYIFDYFGNKFGKLVGYERPEKEAYYMLYLI